MEEIDVKKEETVEEVKEKKKEEVKKEEPQGFVLAEVVTSKETVIAIDGKVVDEQSLLIQIANHLKEQTGFKLK